MLLSYFYNCPKLFLFWQKHAESYLSAVSREVLTISAADNEEIRPKQPPEW